ncbi:hypothetical protein JL721_11392 [Aureococcus anophagefferens]|nr:hypothetical protein JL721_11392 [Aureococcus anophagefferens]
MEPSLVDGGASPLRTGAVVCLAQVVDGVTYRLRSSRCCQLGCSFAPARDGFREDFQFRVVAARRAAAALDGTRLALVPPRAGEGLRFRDGQALALFHEEHAQFLSADPRGPLRALRRAFLGGAEPRGDYGRPLLPVAGLLLFETPGAPRDPAPGAPYDDDFCVSLKRCIMVNVYNGIIDGTMASVSKQISSAGAAYGKGLPTAADLRRMYMQLFFNFVVALLLLNMVAGIIIDTFSQLSQESLEASKIKMNECFTTGLHRSQFETLKEVDFDLDHKPRCAMLNYVHFIGYVMHKDCVNDSPLERAVRDKLRDGDASWIPTLTCFSLENHGQAEREQVGEDEQIRALIADVAARSDARLDALAAAVATRAATRDRAPRPTRARPRRGVYTLTM